MKLLYGGLLAMALTFAFLLQEWMPALAAWTEALTGLPVHEAEWTRNARILLLAAFFFPAALTVSYPGMLVLAFATGLLWEAREALVLEDDPSWMIQGTGWGGTLLLLMLLGSLIQGVRPLYQAGHWLIPLALCLPCIAILVFGEFTWNHVRSGSFALPPGFWGKAALTTFLTWLPVPLVLFLLTRGLAATGCEPNVTPGFSR